MQKRERLVHGTYDASVDLLMSAVEIDLSTGCYLWTRGTTPHGYGRVCIKRKDYFAHRLMYELSNGLQPKSLQTKQFVCHKCDTPRCINPAHLFLGTQDDNLKDMAAKGRACKGEDKHNAKLNSNAVLNIRLSNKSSRTLAQEYGVSAKLIRNVRNNLIWRHVNATRS